ncbi:MAG: hypothetical protein ACE5F1_15020, partial [Planctomycetota bacterium]
ALATIAERLAATTGGKPCRRSSKILGLSLYQGFRCLYLSVEIRQISGAVTELFEILLLRDKHGILLHETAEDAQAHVVGELDGKSLAGLGLGRDVHFCCPACNYRIRTPVPGTWLVLASDPARSESLEKVNLLSLDRDIAMELTVHVGDKIVSTRPVLHSACNDIAKSFGVSRVKLQEGETEIAGIDAHYALMKVRCPDRGMRHFLFYVLEHRPDYYFLMLQGSPKEVLPGSDSVSEMLGAFQLVDPLRNLEQGLQSMRVHASGGRFDGNGQYEYPKLGLGFGGVPGWNCKLGLGGMRFQAQWHSPKDASMLTFSGIDWVSVEDPKRALGEWLSLWEAKQRQSIRPGQDFKSDRETRVKTIGGKRWYLLRYSFLPGGQPEGSQKRARGFLALHIHGSSLLVADGIAAPGRRQGEIVKRLRRSLGTLKL